MYAVQVENKVLKELKFLPKTSLRRILNTLEGLKSDPRPHGAMKLRGLEGWRLRVGDYRVLYTVDDAANIVRIYVVKHRREAYRSPPIH